MASWPAGDWDHAKTLERRNGCVLAYRRSFQGASWDCWTHGQPCASVKDGALTEALQS